MSDNVEQAAKILPAEVITAATVTVEQVDKAKVQARIARLEHLLMIAGHEAECPACNGEAWPLRPPKTVKGLR